MYKNRGVSLGSGVVLAVIGAVLLLFPAASMSFFTILVGLCFLFAGFSALSAWSRTLRGTGFGTAVLAFSLLMIIIALVCIFHPLATASTLTWLVALLVVIGGVAQLATVIFAVGMPGRGIGAISTCIVILFGILALCWPPFIVQFIGVSCLIEGISLVVIALVARPIDVDPL